MSSSQQPSTSADVKFETEVAEYVTIDEQLAALSVQVRELKQKQKTLSTNIVSFMQTENVKRCYAEHVSFSVSETVGQASLSIPLLRTVFENFFSRRSDVTEKLIEAIQKHRKDSAGTRIRLKKSKIRDT